MLPSFWLQHALGPALSLLPVRMSSREAQAMMLSIAFQETKLEARHQIRGSAHGYLQFDVTGVHSVLTHKASHSYASELLRVLDYDPESHADEVWTALEHNDVLCCGLGRLLLWTLPDPMPARNAPAIGYSIYLKSWRPGKPRPDDWPENFESAWELV